MADFVAGDHVAYCVTDDLAHTDTWFCGIVQHIHKWGRTDVLLIDNAVITVATAILTKVTTLHVNQTTPPVVPPAA
jgi:hypothetical protein